MKQWLEIDDGERSVAASLLFYLYQLYATELAKIISKENKDPVHFEVGEMQADGLGKIRYILLGGRSTSLWKSHDGMSTPINVRSRLMCARELMVK